MLPLCYRGAATVAVATLAVAAPRRWVTPAEPCLASTMGPSRRLGFAGVARLPIGMSPKRAAARVCAFRRPAAPDVRRLVAPRLLLHPSAPCIQMPAHADPPPYSLHRLLMRWCRQIFAPPQSLHVLLWRRCAGAGRFSPPRTPCMCSSGTAAGVGAPWELSRRHRVRGVDRGRGHGPRTPSTRGWRGVEAIPVWYTVLPHGP